MNDNSIRELEKLINIIEEKTYNKICGYELKEFLDMKFIRQHRI